MVQEHTIPEAYVRLALGIDSHFEGYVDAYFGPEEWRDEIAQQEAEPLPSLADKAEELLAALKVSNELDKQRVRFLDGQLRAMRAMLQLLMGRELTLRQEASELYDIDVEWVDEATFHDAHELLDKALPPGGSLQNRMDDRRARLKLDEGQVEPLIMLALEEVRNRTRQLIGLPSGEMVEVSFVRDKPWTGYNWYLGNLQSRIEINIDLPVYLDSILDYVAHETYPGHHTELATKEYELVEGEGRLEHCVVALNVPASTVSEGIATRARLALASDEEWDEWSARVIQPAAGKTDLNPEKLQFLRRANKMLGGVDDNAIFLLHERNKGEEEVADYLVEYGLYSQEHARSIVRFAKTPQFRTYGFVYSHGRDLVEELLASVDNKAVAFARLLSEPVIPGMIRSWIASEESAD